MRSVIVVFGAGTNPHGGLSTNLHRRLETAIGAARRNPSATIIVSGGAVTGPAEGPTMQRWLVGRGIRPTRIIVEALARYTLENANNVAPLLVGLRASEITLVTSAFHMPRSEALLKGALHAVAPAHRFRVRRRPARNSLMGAAARALAVSERDKLVRDLQTQAAHPPKIVRAHAWAGSIKMHSKSQAGA